MTIFNIIQQRRKTHGVFKTHAELANTLKSTMRDTPGWETAPAEVREALDMIQHKIARILNGDCMYHDHWIDIAGYALLVIERPKQ